MKKLELENFIRENLAKLEDAALIEAAVKNIMTAYKEDCNDWQALRYLKKRVDQIWKAFKNLSEKNLVGERAKELKRVLDQIKPTGRKPIKK